MGPTPNRFLVYRSTNVWRYSTKTNLLINDFKNALKSSKLTFFGVRPTSPTTNYCDKKLHISLKWKNTLVIF